MVFQLVYHTLQRVKMKVQAAFGLTYAGVEGLSVSYGKGESSNSKR